MEVREVLITALAVIEDPKNWSSEHDFADASGEFVHCRSSINPSRFSIRGSIWVALANGGITIRDGRKTIDECLYALAQTFLVEFQEKTRVKTQELTDYWADGYFLLDYLGKLMKHETVLILFRKTIKRLRDESFQTFQVYDSAHRIGDPLCDGGHCGGDYPGFRKYPLKCACGGLVHLSIEPNIYEFDSYEACDRCGNNYQVLEPPQLVVSNE